MKRVRARKRDIVNLFRGGSQKRMESTENLDLIFGEAKFMAAKAIQVRLKNGSDRMLTADYIIINAGCPPGRVFAEGLQDFPIWTALPSWNSRGAETFIGSRRRIRGLEFGQLFRRLGSKITIVHSRDQLLATEDSDVAEEVAGILKQDGITVLLNSKAERVRRWVRKSKLTARSGKKSRTLSGTHLLLATGRVPNTEKLGAAAAGIALNDRGFVKVNNKLETKMSKACSRLAT